MKVETTGTFEDITFERTVYSMVSYPERAYEAFNSHDGKILREMGVKTRNFVPSKGRLDSLLEDYGPSDVALSYACDDYSLPVEGHIVRGSVKDGKQALRFIEYCMHDHGPISQRPVNPQIPIGDIPFDINQALEGRRTITLITGAVHPEIAWREMYHIIIAEKE